MRSPEERIAELGLRIPDAPEPVAQYLPARRIGELLFISGQGPVRGGVPAFVGRVGKELTIQEGYEAAFICAMNSLAVAKQYLGRLCAVKEVVHLRGFVNSADDFFDQPKVIDGASDLFVKVFGDAGRHARAALGTSSLPGNIPVEIELVIRVSAGRCEC